MKIILGFVIIQCFMYEISSTDALRSLHEYLQLLGYPYPAIPISAAPHNRAPLNPHNQAPDPQVKKPPPPPPDPTLSALSIAHLLAGLSQKAEERPKPVENPSSSSNIDAKLLNNLAVALQLLIVSNIIHSGPPEALTEKPEARSEPIYYAPDVKHSPPQLQYYAEQAAPFASYLPHAESNPAQRCELSKKSLPIIQSPYEALLSSPYSDPVGTYSPLNSRKDLLSPYAMLAKDPNLFSFNDLF